MLFLFGNGSRAFFYLFRNFMCISSVDVSQLIFLFRTIVCWKVLWSSNLGMGLQFLRLLEHPRSSRMNLTGSLYVNDYGGDISWLSWTAELQEAQDKVFLD
ncbi:hypothetical protein L2E82_09171 [Cichorium intybus]|uniref:Uncharacterized protein n=2 Tax=Cichorium intybus TaxID=13427 RepID=A0ACB9G7P8_CICIN|nr:hypothetical protein L2E82_09166 [Cichorium intybus]KAI3779452.1 hypothetical protein L2E82_09171 [Cichorium intybus]